LVEAEGHLCEFSVRYEHVEGQSVIRLHSSVIYYPDYPKAFSQTDHGYGIGFLAWRLHGAAIGHLGSDMNYGHDELRGSGGTWVCDPSLIDLCSFI